MLATTLRVFGVIREVCESAVTSMYRFAIAEAEQSPDVTAALGANRFVNRHRARGAAGSGAVRGRFGRR